MTVAQIDDVFFKFINNPEAWGFIGLLLLAFMLERFLTYRFYEKAIHREQSDIDADNQRQTDLITLIGGLLNDIKKALENNTDAFSQFAIAHQKLEKKIAQTNQELEEKIVQTSTELKDAISQVLSGVTNLSVAISDLQGANERDYGELRILLQHTINKVENIIQELPNGNFENTDSDTAGSRSGSPGDQQSTV